MAYFHLRGRKKTYCLLTKKIKQSLNNYHPVSLLLIRDKTLERLLFNEIYSFFTERDLLFPCQPGFKTRDSCINQHLSFTREIYKSFNDGLAVRNVFVFEK